MNRAAFVLRFLALFAALVAAGGATGAARGYARLLEGAAALASPAATGWWLERRPGANDTRLWYRSGEHALPLQLSLEALALGLLPFLSLLGATPGLGLRRLLTGAALGFAGLFLLDLLVLVLYPLLVSRPNPFTDITGGFLGLLTFVGGPVILWFVLTYDRMRPVWRLGTSRRSHRLARGG
jgi:hypothetical protein